MSLRGPIQDHNLNKLVQGTSRISIGDIPISFTEDDAPPFESINANIKGFKAPGLTLKYASEYSYKAKTHISITEDNEYQDAILSVEMFMDDRMENYWALHRYMETIQSGKTGGWITEDPNDQPYGIDGRYRNRLMYIPIIDITMADPSFQHHQTLRFSRCFPTRLEDISMAFPDDVAPVTFVASFIFGKREIIRTTPYAPSSDQVPPNSVLA
jgi:hypothetical protein